MTSYVAIDFETANERRDSACAVGVVRVDQGEITKFWTSIINPEVPFAPMNSSIHGLTSTDVSSSPLFPEVLERILETAVGTELMVAHSAAFDMQVLRGTAQRYRVHLGEQAYACTKVFARQWFPGWPSYSLKYIVEQLEIVQALGGDMHHVALWDAAASMLIAEHGLQRGRFVTWAEAADAAHIRLGVVSDLNYTGTAHRVTSGDAKIVPQRRWDADINPEHPLFGRTVCFTGHLSHYTRREAAQAVVDAGGEFTDSVTMQTDLLVVGMQDLARLNGHQHSGKMRRAMEMAANGHSIEIIEETDFYRLLLK